MVLPRKPKTKPSFQNIITTLLLLIVSSILIYNSYKSIKASLYMISLYRPRFKQLQKQYVQIIKKQNELDYVTSPFYLEQQLRNSLNYYKPGEKLVIFTQQLPNTTPTPTPSPPPPYKMWLKLLTVGHKDK